MYTIFFSFSAKCIIQRLHIGLEKMHFAELLPRVANEKSASSTDSVSLFFLQHAGPANCQLSRWSYYSCTCHHHHHCFSARQNAVKDRWDWVFEIPAISALFSSSVIVSWSKEIISLYDNCLCKSSSRRLSLEMGNYLLIFPIANAIISFSFNFKLCSLLCASFQKEAKYLGLLTTSLHKKGRWSGKHLRCAAASIFPVTSIFCSRLLSSQRL